MTELEMFRKMLDKSGVHFWSASDNTLKTFWFGVWVSTSETRCLRFYFNTETGNLIKVK